MIRKTLSFLAVMALLVVSFAFTSGNAVAASHSTSSVKFGVPFTAPVDFGVVQKICPNVSIHLNGAQHTLTCLKASHGVHPYLSRASCNFGTENIIVSNNTGALCFFGSGYLGVTIYQVNSVENVEGGGIGGPAWMRYYHPSGVSCSIYAFDTKNFGNGNTNVTVTQLDWGQYNGPMC